MADIVVELLFNLLGATVFIGFLYFCFEKPQGTLMKALPFVSAILLIFVSTTIVTHNNSYINYCMGLLFAVLIMELYAIIFLRGKIYLRILMPVVAVVLNVVLVHAAALFVTLVTKADFETAMLTSAVTRYSFVVAVNVAYILIMWIMMRAFTKKRLFSGSAEIISFIVIPILCTVVIYCVIYIFVLSNYNVTMLPYIVAVCADMLLITASICIVLARISKVNNAMIECLILAGREKLYHQSILSVNEQIKQMSSIKHDMKNTLITMKLLLQNGKTDEAALLCEETTQSLQNVYTPLNTDNPILNAIVNVELQKACNKGIDMRVEIHNTLKTLTPSHIVSLVGNLCDNAQEYLVTQPEGSRKMELKIHSHINYIIILCENTISESVLERNPHLATSKTNKENHGKGMGILRRIAKEYNGQVSVSERDGNFIVSVLLENPDK